MKETLALKSISDDELLDSLTALVQQSRRVESELVAHVGEVDRRRLYLREATSSMFVYCTEVLHLSEHEAYMRIAVARASRKCPMLLTMLRDGRLHLSAIAKLAPHLDRLDLVGREQLLERATHKSKRRVEELVASLSAKPDVPATIRKLPQRRQGVTPETGRDCGTAGAGGASGIAGTGGAGGIAGTGETAGAGGTAGAGARSVMGLGPDRVDVPSTSADPMPPGHSGQGGEGSVTDPGTTERVQSARPVESATVQPLAPARYKVTFTGGSELRDKLDRLQSLMPDCDLAAIIEQAVTEKLERAEARRFGKTKNPRKKLDGTDTSSRSRNIPAAVKRVVVARDCGQCTFVNVAGRRCRSRSGLEFHHDKPYGLGGDRSPGNIRLLCRAHNGYLAESTYGKDVIGRYRREGVSGT